MDAALAYDESARLLKGTSWKVNFQTRQEYEKAKAKELARAGQNGTRDVDVAGSLAAVALKVEEIASTVAMSSSSSSSSSFSSSSGVVRRSLLLPIKCDYSHLLYEQRLSSGLAEEIRRDEGAATKGSNSERDATSTDATKLLHPPPNDNNLTSLNNSKVTPSPTLPISPPIMLSSKKKQEESSSSASSQFMQEPPSSSRADTPLPITPNPTRHVLGTEKNTPDSVIRPRVLTYRPGSMESEVISGNSPVHDYQSTIEEKEATVLVLESMLGTNDEITTPQFSPKKSNSIGTSTTTATIAEPAKKNVPTSLPKPPAPPPPPVIQNGTLAAASALMTLFGNERSPQD